MSEQPSEKVEVEETSNEIYNRQAISDTILRDVKKTVGETDIRPKVVEHLANREIEERTTMLVQAFDLRRQKNTDVTKVRGDQAYDGDGNHLEMTWTKAQLKEKATAQKALAKVDKAISDAVEKADYSLLKNLVGNKGAL